MSLSFLPITRSEVDALGWSGVDVVLVTGDAYVDHPSFGSAVIGRVLEAEGYRVAIMAMPPWREPGAASMFGRPRLFFGVSSGNVDSMLSRYTAFRKVRNDDPYAPGGAAGERPERAVIVYANMIRSVYKNVPIVIGGIEASMRRFAHYDFWDDRVRRSIMLDSRADILVYGMGERQIVEIARRLDAGEGLSGIPGTVELRREPPAGAHLLPPEAEAIRDRRAYSRFYREFHQNQHRVLAQESGKRYIVQHPPPRMSGGELDAVHALPFARLPHPFYTNEVPGFATVRASLVSHRGCVSGCAFCSIALHQGRRIVRRSEGSVLEEAALLASSKGFGGHITDVGGPSANMYGAGCAADWRCSRESCLYPEICPNLRINTASWMGLLARTLELPGVRHVTVGSGIRYDLFMRDDPSLLDRLARHHVSGRLKIAPEHTSAGVLDVMRKRHLYGMEDFADAFHSASRRAGRRQYIVPYLMSCHPGCRMGDMREMRKRVLAAFGFVPEQVQAFIPLPLTLSSAIYHTGMDPLTGEEIFVARTDQERRGQHDVFHKKRNS